MLMCRQVARALAEHRYYELPWYRRWGLKMHIALCGVCGRYHRQMVVMQDGVKIYLDHEAHDDLHSTIQLSEQARKRIADELAAKEAEQGGSES